MDINLKNLNQAIVVELREIDDLPQPKDVEFFIEPAYDVYENNKDGKRWSARYSNKKEVDEYFKSLILDKVYPLMLSEPLSRHEYPFSLDFMRKNTNVGAMLLRDEIGWFQPTHNDNRSYIMAGAVHLQDSFGGGTHIYGVEGSNATLKPKPIYQAPSESNTGAFWLNTNHAWHSIGPTPSERFFYLVHVTWKMSTMIEYAT